MCVCVCVNPNPHKKKKKNTKKKKTLEEENAKHSSHDDGKRRVATVFWFFIINNHHHHSTTWKTFFFLFCDTHTHTHDPCPQPAFSQFFFFPPCQIQWGTGNTKKKNLTTTHFTYKKTPRVIPVVEQKPQVWVLAIYALLPGSQSGCCNYKSSLSVSLFVCVYHHLYPRCR